MALITRSRDELKEKIVKKLGKKGKTLAQLSEQIKGSTVKQLCVPMGQLVREGKALKLKGNPPTYAKGSDS